MANKSFFRRIPPLTLFIIFSLLIAVHTFASTTQLQIKIMGCGNNEIEFDEVCDGTDLAGKTCQDFGETHGDLACASTCDAFDISGCYTPPTPPPPPGGGGGWAPPPIETKVIIKGKAYPLSSVTILQDGKIATTIQADSQANFKMEITNITPGVWTFGVWSEDKRGVKSLTFSFTTNIISGITTTISGIFLPPTIEIDKTFVQKGEILNILGQTAPQSEISIIVNSPEEIIKKTKAETDGTWFYGFDTTPLEEGSHGTRANATSLEGLSSTFSQTLTFSVGRELIEKLCPKGDFNKDGKVNLVDFSILLYWWGRYNACADQNRDGIVGLADFSIMLHWWTG